MTRLSVSALLAALLATVLAAGCGADSTDNDTAAATTRKTPAQVAAAVGDPKPIGMIPCHVRSGGFKVEVIHISCDQTRHLLRHWNPSPTLFGNQAQRDVLVSQGDWRCWMRLEKQGGPITNVCTRGRQLIAYSFA
jgi:hypothetical protein